MISNNNLNNNTSHRKSKPSYKLAKGPLACLKLIHHYETLPEGKGYCYLNQESIGQKLDNHGHKKVCQKQVKRYFQVLKMLGLINCYKPRTHSSYNTNTTSIAKLYLTTNISKQKESYKYEIEKCPHSSSYSANHSLGRRGQLKRQASALKLKNITYIERQKAGMLTSICFNTYEEYSSQNINKCKSARNVSLYDDKIRTLLDAPRETVMRIKKDPKKAFEFMRERDGKHIEPRQMLEYVNARQDQYEANYMERQWARRKEKWESYKNANPIRPDFDKFEHDQKIKRKEWEFMMDESRIANEKIKSTKESLADMEKKADEHRPSDDFVQSQLSKMRAMLQGRKEL